MWLYLHHCWRRSAACVSALFIACVDTLLEFVVQVGEIRARGSCTNSSAVERPADSRGTSSVPWRISPKVLLSTKLWMNSEMKQLWTDSWQLTEQKNQTIVPQFECRNAIIYHLVLLKIFLSSTLKLGIYFLAFFCHFDPFLCSSLLISYKSTLMCGCLLRPGSLDGTFQVFASAEVAVLPEAKQSIIWALHWLQPRMHVMDSMHTHMHSWTHVACWPPTEMASVGRSLCTVTADRSLLALDSRWHRTQI